MLVIAATFGLLLSLIRLLRRIIRPIWRMHKNSVAFFIFPQITCSAKNTLIARVLYGITTGTMKPIYDSDNTGSDPPLCAGGVNGEPIIKVHKIMYMGGEEESVIVKLY